MDSTRSPLAQKSDAHPRSSARRRAPHDPSGLLAAPPQICPPKFGPNLSGARRRGASRPARPVTSGGTLRARLVRRARAAPLWHSRGSPAPGWLVRFWHARGRHCAPKARARRFPLARVSRLSRRPECACAARIASPGSRWTWLQRARAISCKPSSPRGFVDLNGEPAIAVWPVLKVLSDRVAGRRLRHCISYSHTPD